MGHRRSRWSRQGGRDERERMGAFLRNVTFAYRAIFSYFTIFLKKPCWDVQGVH